ncbi:hypothetical protein Mal4_25190 [Maioricimonas rarisocia]|uniref:Glycosyl hydrolases family 43 n=1 Tax=Maioricimonas rarisocia TaxID=2528026 RepID=A0A517Z6X6_9PLAN|nr:hypothetical protein [Maioricimonas rarisocia]QDU38194.1 hypothetical protein Mal4_25190 [Maioricimonas rarisocia]
MSAADPRHWGQVPVFDPQSGQVVVEPTGSGKGYWVGAPGVYYDVESATFYLTYRVRRPRGVEPDRGAEIHIARSSDGIQFEEIWVGRKEELNTTSIERCVIARSDSGAWRLYVSYVDPEDARWRTDVTEANAPDAFKLADCRPVLTPAQLGVEGVKDPFLFRVGGMLHMIVSFATADQSASHDELHGTHDAYNTGLIRSRTGLATSVDGQTWNWEGEIFGPSESGWDCYCARIGSVWRQDGLWIGYYDGSADVSENYEERVGLVCGSDLHSLKRMTPDGPLMIQPNASGALRYFDVVALEDRTLIYYETAREDGSHDLRVFVAPAV